MGWQDGTPIQSPAQQPAQPNQPAMMPSAQQPLDPTRTPNLNQETGQQPAWMSGTPAQQPSLPPDQQMGMARGLAHEFVSGVPVAGPLALKGLSLANSYINNDTYAEEEAKRQASEGGFEKEHPYASTAAQIGGGVASMLGLGGTALGARLLGLTGSLPGMIARGATSGAAIGAADALARGGDPATGAMYGGVGGAAGPALGRAVSTVAAPFINEARGALNPAAEASRVVAGGIAADRAAGQGGLTATEMAANPAAVVMHQGGPTTEGIARSAANNSPEARGMLNRTIDDTFTGQSSRLEDWINSRYNFPDAASQQAALDQAASGINGQRYQAAHAIGDQKFPGGLFNNSPDLQKLGSSDYLQEAMRKAIKQSTGNMAPQMTMQNAGMQTWDYAYRNLRDMGNAAYRAGLSHEGGFISTQAKQLRSVLDNMVPEYGAARSGAEAFFNASDALEAGQNFANTGKPDINGARQAFVGMTPTDRQLFHDGYLSQIIQNARASGDRRNWIATLNSSPVRRQAMDMALGTQGSQELTAFLHTESLMDRFRGAVQGNSTTARQLMELGLATGVGSEFGDANPLTDPAAFMKSALLYGGLRYGRGRIQERVAQQVASLLTSRDQAAVNRGMQLVTRNSNLFGAVQNADAALGGIGARSVAQTANRPPQALPAQ